MNPLRGNTLKRKLIIFICLLFCSVSITLFFVTQYFFSNIITDKSLSYFKETISQIAYRVDTEISIRDQFVSKITQNPTIAYLLNDIMYGNKNREVIIPQVMAEVLRFQPGKVGSLQDVYIFPKEGYPINCYYNEAITEIDPYSQSILKRSDGKSSGQTIWDDIYLETNQMSSYTPILDANKVIGLVRTRYSKDFLSQILDNVQLSSDNFIIIADKSGNIIYSSNRNLIGKNRNMISTNGNYMITSSLTNDGWTVVGVVPRSAVSKQITNMSIIFLTLYLITIGFVLIAVTVYSNRVLKPLNNIVKGMKEIQKGNLGVNIETSTSDEFGFIAENFNYMVYRINSLVQQVYRQQKASQMATMAALEAKLNPHFLYNTLDAIYWMLLIKENFSEADMVIKLSNMLRYSISHSGDFVPLSEDISQIENYISLLQCRFGDKLNYHVLIEEEVKNVPIPKLLLQPLVENTIKHGFKDMEIDGLLEIECRADGDTILFVVRDNGIGISEEKLENVFTCGLGLRITQDRIYYFYGDKYGMDITSEEGKGTEFTLKISRFPKLDFNSFLDPIQNDMTITTIR